MSKIQKVRGTYDILPEDQKYWDFIIKTFEEMSLASGFGKITTPIIEKASIFERPIGKGTDVIDKEMYVLESKKDDTKEKLVLRPEATASVVRSYIENGLKTMTQPVSLYYHGPMFRHDRPQKGRFRQFYQIGAEVLGEMDPIIDAQIISFVCRLLNEFKTGDFTIQINSIGDSKTRYKYAKKLKEYYRLYIKNLCSDCRVRLNKNPLRLLDCKDQGCQKYKEGAPQIIDFLSPQDKDHFTEVLEYLDELEIPYELNTHLVRGLDYYTRTVFEVWPKDQKDIKDPAGFTLVAGGRYDDLAELLGEKKIPGIGFSFGVERIIEILKINEVQILHHDMPDVFVVQLGKLAKKKSLKLIEKLRENGLRVISAMGKESIKSQMKLADKTKASLALILGQKEVLDGTVIIKDMSGGIQEVVDWGGAVEEIKKRLPKEDI